MKTITPFRLALVLLLSGLPALGAEPGGASAFAPPMPLNAHLRFALAEGAYFRGVRLSPDMVRDGRFEFSTSGFSAGVLADDATERASMRNIFGAYSCALGRAGDVSVGLEKHFLPEQLAGSWSEWFVEWRSVPRRGFSFTAAQHARTSGGRYHTRVGMIHSWRLSQAPFVLSSSVHLGAGGAFARSYRWNFAEWHADISCRLLPESTIGITADAVRRIGQLKHWTKSSSTDLIVGVFIAFHTRDAARKQILIMPQKRRP